MLMNFIRALLDALFRRSIVARYTAEILLFTAQVRNLREDESAIRYLHARIQHTRDYYADARWGKHSFDLMKPFLVEKKYPSCYRVFQGSADDPNKIGQKPFLYTLAAVRFPELHDVVCTMWSMILGPNACREDFPDGFYRVKN